MTAGKKALYSKALAGSVAYIALKNMDKVNFFSWSEGIQNKKLNMQAGQSFAQAVQFLEELEQNGETSFTKTIKQCSGLPLGRGISILFSDLLTEDDWKEGISYCSIKSKRSFWFGCWQKKRYLLKSEEPFVWWIKKQNKQETWK